MSTATLNGTPATGFESLTAWLQNTDPVKLAGALPAESEHDDGGEKATEGARSSENDTDVKKITNGNAVPGAGQNPSGKMDNPIEGSGLNQSTTGKNPEVERAVKTVKDEEEKMAAADLNTPEGFKAAHDALVTAYAQLPILLAHCGVEMPKVEAPAKAAGEQPGPATPVQVGDPAAAMGYATKEAADKAAAAVVAGYQKMGSERAALTGQYLRGYDDTMALIVKMAEDGSLEAAMAAQGGHGGGGGMPAIDPNAGAPPAAGGGNPAAAMPGQDPAAGGGDPAAGGGAGGEPSMEEIIAALQEMGITPEQLQQIIGQAQGGVESAPPEAASPEEKAAAVQALKGWSKMASDMTPYMRSGKYSFKPAADNTPERKRRQAAKDYILELQKFGGGN